MLKNRKLTLALGFGLASLIGVAAAHPRHSEPDRAGLRHHDQWTSQYGHSHSRHHDRRYAKGEWRLNVNRCPDLREDRRDRRYHRGWHDRREDRRDSRIVHCPSRAWEWVGTGRYHKHAKIPPRPDYRQFKRDRHGNIVASFNGRNVQIRVVTR